MRNNSMQPIRTAAAGLAVMLLVACPENFAYARGGMGGRGGGGRPMGGGGGRPSMGGMSRPSMGGGGMSRPNMGGMSRPNMGGMNRPSMGNVGGHSPNIGRPSTPSGGRPSLGGMGGGPNISRPSTPNIGSRPSTPGGQVKPSVRPGNAFQPPARPSPGGGSRPGGGIGDRPGIADRPGLGGGDRPSFGNINRPATLPANVGRPGVGGGRPGIGGGDRPGIGGNRPGIGDRPGIGNRPDRPTIGGDRPNRPNIGGGINIGNDINIGNIGGGHNIGNRPGWDRPNWNRPDWGWGHGDWHDRWHNNCIRDHYHGWYNGCWPGYWGSAWYAPLAWGAVGWGLGSMTSGWGYGSGYYNPYYDTSAGGGYDYSQPVVVNNYLSSDADASGGTAQAQQDTPQTKQALSEFDEGMANFKSADYRGALAHFNAALKTLPNDPVVHEVRALTLFALGDYSAAGAALNSLLSSAPGMDWTSMSSLYGNADDYTKQLRKLEAHCKANPKDASAEFVLAYHYLVIGAKDDAIKVLRKVVAEQPKDVTAKRMLDALAPADNAAPQRAAPPSAAGGPETDLVGTWRAKAGDTTIELAVDDESNFTWKALSGGKVGAELAGDLATTDGGIVLASKDKGSMAGSVKSEGPDKWQFVITGAPADDPGLTFSRVK